MIKNSTLSFLALIAGVVLARHESGWLSQWLMLAIVVWYWLSHGLRLGLSNMRSMAIIIACSVLFVLVFRALFPTTDDLASTGVRINADLNPGSFATLSESHSVALIVDFERKPTAEERYLSVQTLTHSDNGLHYSRRKLILNTELLPQAAQWSQESLRGLSLEKAIAYLKQILQQGYTYTLHPGKLNSEHPFDEFWFKQKSGYCEHYAAAVATLLQLSGFKARVVSGYAGGRWNPLLSQLIYEDADAHAWVEVYSPEQKKWLTMDPTEWVAPSLHDDREGILSSIGQREVWILAITLLALAAALYLSPSRLSPLALLDRKLTKQERRYDLSSLGLTLTERMERLASLDAPKAARFHSLIQWYRLAYFAPQSAMRDKDEFKKAIARLN